jgi:2-methylcitrate dehydratase PrpD
LFIIIVKQYREAAMGTVEQRWAEFVVETTADRVPAAAIAAAGRSVFDGIGCILAAAADPAARPVVGLATSEGNGAGASIVGTSVRTAPGSAALANGTLTHWLEFDDGRGACGHPASVLLPGALAVGEPRGVSGRDLLVAYAVGLEAATHISDACTYEEKDSGFHRTPLFGTIGATAVAARLGGLDPRRTMMALGIAGSMGSGVCQNFGTFTKPLHAGLAARNAVTAVRLAGEGWTGSENILAGPAGWAAGYTTTFDYPAMSRDLGSEWRTADSPPMWKAFPCCGASHGPLSSLLGLMAEHGFTHRDVASIEVGAPHDSMVMMYDDPDSGYQGKFSLRYTIATALIDGRIDLGSFTDEKLQRPEYAEVSARLRINLTSKWDLAVGGAGTDGKRFKPGDGLPVTVRLTSGETVSRSTPQIPGLQTDEEILAKFRGNAGRTLPADRVEAAVSQWSAPESIDDVRAAMATIRL